MTRALVDPGGRELEGLAALGIDFSGKNVLDVGCGEGRVVWRIADRARSVLGVDTDTERIAKARAGTPKRLAHKVAFQDASIVELDEPPGRFDLVFFTWSL